MSKRAKVLYAKPHFKSSLLTIHIDWQKVGDIDFGSSLNSDPLNIAIFRARNANCIIEKGYLCFWGGS